eukprot:GHVH01011672.1.p1 GENE.GHVH01011672.1~~GHVH01011672.1.p1  ORF type:complete len:798 (+),score=87.35 GHVH01011672.1:1814-4207(+)
MSDKSDEQLNNYRCVSLGGDVKWGFGPCLFLEETVQSGRRILINAPENLQRMTVDWNLSIYRTSDIFITKLEPAFIGGLPGALMSMETTLQGNYLSTFGSCDKERPPLPVWTDVPNDLLPVDLLGGGGIRGKQRISNAQNNVLRIWGPPGIISFIQGMTENFCGSKLYALNMMVIELLPSRAVTHRTVKRAKLSSGSSRSPPEIESLSLSRPRHRQLTPNYPVSGEECCRASRVPPCFYVALDDDNGLEFWATHQDSEGKFDQKKAEELGVVGKHISRRKELAIGKTIEIDGVKISPSDVLSGGCTGAQWIICNSVTKSRFLTHPKLYSSVLNSHINEGHFNVPPPDIERVSSVVVLQCTQDLVTLRAQFPKIAKNEGIAVCCPSATSSRVVIPCGVLRNHKHQFDQSFDCLEIDNVATSANADVIEPLDSIQLGGSSSSILRCTSTAGGTHGRLVVEAQDGLLPPPSVDSNPEGVPTVLICGTSSAVPTRQRNVTGIFVQTSSTNVVLLDVGEGSTSQFILANRGDLRPFSQISTLVISHTHADHFNGLPVLLEFRRRAFELAPEKTFQPLRIICPERFKEIVNVWDATFHLETEYEMSFHGPDDTVVELDDGVQLSTCSNFHIPESRSLRLDWALADGANPQRRFSIFFSGDTGFAGSQNIVRLAKRVNLMIHEATFEDGEEDLAESKNHTTAGQALSNAVQARCPHLILTHFSARLGQQGSVPDVDTFLRRFRDGLQGDYTIYPNGLIQLEQNKYSGSNCTMDIAEDLMRFPIPGDHQVTRPPGEYSLHNPMMD